ncbi:hypothetical protein JHK87_054467 [Glycine soja]|nr:hypothetical protein JHK87_054467 [Glycine soja]
MNSHPLRPSLYPPVHDVLQSQWAYLGLAQPRTIVPGLVTALLGVFMGSTPHCTLSKLARTYHAEKLMAFSIGLTQFVISSEQETAKEILDSPDFADRPVKESAYEFLFHRYYVVHLTIGESHA